MQPNILLVLTDQQQDLRAHDGSDLQRFADAHLTHQTKLAEKGTRFAQHRIAASACVPSRASIFTGKSPWVHGVSQTDGLAKLATDPEMTWLDPNKHQTLGHLFREAGYLTPYFGKWHLSHANLHNAEKPVPDSDEAGKARLSALYRQSQPLETYGFQDWVGPEPHGADPLNAGLNRDKGYVAAACQWLKDYASKTSRRPFMMVVSLVNPHDIVFWPAWSLWRKGNLRLEHIPAISAPSSATEDTRRHPSVLKAYRHHYNAAYGPIPIVRWLYERSPETYRRFYCSLVKAADDQLGILIDALNDVHLSETTHVVFTSDHGELLGAHGGLHQKWYNAFEETMRVPLVIYSPTRSVGTAATRDDLTNHLDIAPTLLGFAGLNNTSAAATLPGRDLFGSAPARDSYFLTEDHILEGAHQEGAVGRRFPFVKYLWPLGYRGLSATRTSVEALIAVVTQTNQAPHTWKIIRYFDPIHRLPTAHDEWSLFDLTVDPHELDDLADNSAYEWALLTLRRRLDLARAHAGGPTREPTTKEKGAGSLHDGSFSV